MRACVSRYVCVYVSVRLPSAHCHLEEIHKACVGVCVRLSVHITRTVMRLVSSLVSDEESRGRSEFLIFSRTTLCRATDQKPVGSMACTFCFDPLLDRLAPLLEKV